MIDELNIRRAAEKFEEIESEKKGFNGTKPVHLAYAEGYFGGFMSGAQWAQKEFVKNLWHSSKEEPKEKDYIITKYFDADEKEEMYELDSIQGLVNWEEYSTLNCIMKWCYLSDILPQKGGKE